MPALFEITDDILEAYETLVDSDGEVSEENEGKLAALAAIQSEKLDSYFYVIRKAEMEEAAAKAMYEQWKKKADARRKAIDWLKNAVQTHLAATGTPKITTPNGNTFAVQKNGGKRPVVTLNVTPMELKGTPFARVKEEVSFDFDAIREALDRGDQDAAKFAAFGEPGFHLRLK